jgi:predicted Zn-dependent protease with MMP-like domain
MRDRDFEELVEQGLKEVPARFRRRLRNVVFVVEDEPPRPGLLGLYQGRPLTTRSVSQPIAEPDRITIYQGPHERMARNASDLRRAVAETVWHEVGHYFGMDERQVRAAERRRAAVRRR